MFSVEQIPDKDDVFYRIHRSQVSIELDGGIELFPHAFREREDDNGQNKSMSTDWEKYSTPQISRNRARTPKDNLIVSLNVGFLRSLTLLVEHSPVEEKKENNVVIEHANQAHTDVKSGDKKIKSNEIRLKLLDEAVIEIEL